MVALGQTHSLESRALMSEKRKARAPETPEQKEKRIEAIRKSLSNKPLPEEQKNKIRDSVQKTIAEKGKKGVFKMTQGEIAVESFFKKRNYKILSQYRINGKGHPYDFYIEDLKLIVEFDGAHHWKPAWYKKTITEGEIELRRVQYKDMLNNGHARHHGYSIIRIIGENTVGDSYHGTMEQQLINQGWGWLI